ncbi:MAG: hypothetical protein KF708_07890 [Pirellulales bacterium]|nr:hypothetical protein [Pirellulales bacterium]
MLYEPVQKNRLFAAGLKYSDITWTSIADILNAFEKRIDQWYLAPVRLLRQQPGQHGAFAAMSISCLLVDCLCQFHAGKVTSNRTLFTKFVEKQLPNYKRPISPPIEFPKVDSHNCTYELDAAGAIKTRRLSSVADALYYIYRCGLLHSAHAPLCGVISGLSTRRFSIRKKSLAKYGSIGTAGGDCPVIVIEPWKLFDDVETFFKRYLGKLKTASPTDAIRRHFNAKFEDCFGVSIASAV